MPHASHRLDLLVLPKTLDQPLNEEAVVRLFRGWGVGQEGRTNQDQDLVDGGCRRVWLDQPGRLMLFGNQSGGFRVRCPETRDNISMVFGQAHRAWKSGAERTLKCPACSRSHALEACVFEPPAAFSTWAIVFSDVRGVELMPGVSAQIEQTLGPFKVVLRRP